MTNKNEPKTIVFLDEMLDNFSDSDSDEDEKISIWIKDGVYIRPSTNMSVLPKLEPGVYTVNFSRDQGMYCKKLTNVSDELFTFSDSVTVKLLSEINNFWDKEELYKSNKLVHKRGILLEGYPGTGKSSIISLLSNEIIKREGIVFKIQSPNNINVFIDFMQMAFRKIQADTPIITIIEDLDQYTDVESEILDFLDGKMNINHNIVLCTTNNSDALPDTFLRPSRIDLKIEIPLPSEKTREEYFKFKNVPSEDIETLVTKSDSFSLADLKELYICHYLLDYTIDDAIEKILSSKDKKDFTKSPNKSNKFGV